MWQARVRRLPLLSSQICCWGRGGRGRGAGRGVALGAAAADPVAAPPLPLAGGAWLHEAQDEAEETARAEKIAEGAEGIEKIRIVGFLWEYFKLNYRAAGLAWRTVTLVLLNQFENFYIFIKL